MISRSCKPTTLDVRIDGSYLIQVQPIFCESEFRRFHFSNGKIRLSWVKMDGLRKLTILKSKIGRSQRPKLNFSKGRNLKKPNEDCLKKQKQTVTKSKQVDSLFCFFLYFHSNKKCFDFETNPVRVDKSGIHRENRPSDFFHQQHDILHLKKPQKSKKRKGLHVKKRTRVIPFYIRKAILFRFVVLRVRNFLIKYSFA